MNILTKHSNKRPYIVKELPVIDQGWSVFTNDYFAK